MCKDCTYLIIPCYIFLWPSDYAAAFINFVFRKLYTSTTYGALSTKTNQMPMAITC